MKYTVSCIQTNYTGLIEAWGIDYDSVIAKPSVTYTYQVNDSAKRLMLTTLDPFIVEFRFQNWRWLSKYKTFASPQLSTIEQITAQQTFTTKIDFSQIEEEEDDYKVAGRIYMYTNSTVPRYTMDDYGFFFEVEGWTEPTTGINVVFIVVITLLSLALAAFAGLVIFCYCRRKYKMKQLLKSAEQ
mmetsp:Transcript_43319/g.50883  ORF Transcript_43319/g.50883 Transcript_43319/m.50883 type:complete len:185 (-) Transcript_43319:30-584(-)